MTATAEARSILDQLMGADRDAPLPKGAALPRSSKSKRPILFDHGGGGGGGMVLPSSKKSKSCHDSDVDPLYCAWGVDVYDLFVNTKSDLGPNPYTVDEGARKEYLSLSPEERDRLGFEWRLFSKLQELVSFCDRTVSRNNDKLQRELQRQAQKKATVVTTDYHVKDVNEGAVEELVRTEIRLQDMKDEIGRTLAKLTLVRSKEDAILQKQREEWEAGKEEDKKKESGTEEGNAGIGDAVVKMEQDESTGGEEAKDAPAAVKQEPDADSSKPSEEAEKNEGQADPSPPPVPADNSADLAELGRLTLEKQALLCKIADMISRVAPMENSIQVQLKNLNYVKSDTTTDKTVCEISGNFMSARDADERIAAHYAGKQYVGWKLVRDKLKEMIQKYGRGGPPRPQMMDRGGRGGGGTLMSHQQYQQQQRRGVGGGGGGGGDRGGGRDDRYGGGDRRGPRNDGRWERGGGGGGPYGRGGGGSGYDRDQRRGSDYRDDGFRRGSYGRR